MNPFHVGQEVVCVNNGPILDDGRLAAPAFAYGMEAKKVYKITQVQDEYVGIEGVQGHFRKGDVGWHHSRFRPVVKRSTEAGVAALKKIAEDATKKERVRDSAGLRNNQAEPV